MAKDSRTLDDLSDEEYEDYLNNPDKYEDITSNTEETYINMMFPDRESDDDEIW